MGKSSETTVGYRYYFGLHMGISRGPVDELVEIKVGDKRAWPLRRTVKVSGGCVLQPIGGDINNGMEFVCTPEVFATMEAADPVTTSQRIKIDAPKLFGGDDGEGGIVGNCDVMMGENTQQVNPDLAAMLGGLVSAFRGMFTLFYDGLVTSLNPYPKPWKFRVRRSTKGWDGDVWFPEKATVLMEVLAAEFEGEEPTPQLIKAMNPAHIIYECLTNRQWGRGLPREMIDDDKFTYAANQLCCEGFGLCLKWMREDDISVFMQTVIDHIGAVLYPSRETGLMELVLIRNDYVAANLPLYTTENGLLTFEDDDAGTSENLVNEVVVKWVDPITGNERQTRVQNIAAMQAAGSITSKSVSYPGIPTPELAARVAQRDLRVNGTVLRRFKMTFDRRGWQITPGKVFRVNVPNRGIGNMVLRAGKVEDSNQDGSVITVTAVEDIFGLPETSFVDFVPPAAPQNRDPSNADPARAIELGYIDIMKVKGADAAAVTDDETFIALLGAQPSAFAINFNVTTGPAGSGLEDRGLGDWTPVASITALEPLQTDVTLSDIVQPDLIVVGDAAMIDNEVVQVAAWDSQTKEMTILRGCADTIPATHTAGSIIWFHYAGLGSDPTSWTAAEDLEGKILTRTFQGTLNAADATLLEITTVNRHIRPYPPGLVKIDGTPFPDVGVAPIGFTMTWVGRNRITQAENLLPHTAPNVAAEMGTTYEVTVKKASDNSILRTDVGITDLFWQYTSTKWVADGANTNVKLELRSKRDGNYSWQFYSIPVEIFPDSGWGANWGYNWGGSSSLPSIASSMQQEAAPVRDGNRQVIYFKFGGIPTDGAFNPPRPQQFHIDFRDVVGNALYSPRSTLYAGQSSPIPYTNDRLLTLGSDAGVPGDHGVAYFVTTNGLDIEYGKRPPSGSPYITPDGWCDYFSIPGFDHAIAFPAGERVYVFFDPANQIGQGDAPWTITGYTTPDFPWAPTVFPSAFAIAPNWEDKVTVARPQITLVTIGETVFTDYEYKVTLNGVDFTYTSVGGDDKDDVGNALKTAIDADSNYTATYNAGTSTITITGVGGVDYTFEVSVAHI